MGSNPNTGYFIYHLSQLFVVKFVPCLKKTDNEQEEAGYCHSLKQSSMSYSSFFYVSADYLTVPFTGFIFSIGS